MKKFLFLLVAMLFATAVRAYDFKVDGLSYNIISREDQTVELASVGGVTDLTIPSSITVDGSLYAVVRIGVRAFAQCRRLTSVTIPDSVTEIGRGAFMSCGSLTSVTIPNSVTEIGESDFRWCSSLTSVYYNTTEPKIVSVSTFDSLTYEDATLYVPESAVEIFRQTEPWKEFRNIQGYIFPSGVETVTDGADGTEPREYFNLSGVKVADAEEALTRGIYIVRQGGKTRKIAVK